MVPRSPQPHGMASTLMAHGTWPCSSSLPPATDRPTAALLLPVYRVPRSGVEWSRVVGGGRGPLLPCDFAHEYGLLAYFLD